MFGNLPPVHRFSKREERGEKERERERARERGYSIFRSAVVHSPVVFNGLRRHEHWEPQYEDILAP